MSVSEPQERELLHPDDFIDQITNEIDQYFEDAEYNQMWLSKSKANQNDDAVKMTILNRLFVGFYNEIYIRDSVMNTVSITPDVKTQQALLRQVDDEHTHAGWILKILNERGYDPRLLGGTPSRGYRLFWDYLLGRHNRAIYAKDPFNFLNAIATTQLVNERLFGLRATEVFADSIAHVDEEIAVLYGEKIRKDEIFHTINLPEMILKNHAKTYEAQQAVREGVECSKMFLSIISEEMKNLKQRDYKECKVS